jgi:hypothetical protein
LESPLLSLDCWGWCSANKAGGGFLRRESRLQARLRLTLPFKAKISSNVQTCNPRQAMEEKPLIKRGLRTLELRKWELREGRIDISLRASVSRYSL